MKQLTFLAPLLIIFSLGLSQEATAQGRSAALSPIWQQAQANERARQERLAREATAREAQRQRDYQSQQAAERDRQQRIRNSRLAESARCLEGSWKVAALSNSQGGADLDITSNGLVYLGGSLLSHQPGISIYLHSTSCLH